MASTLVSLADLLTALHSTQEADRPALARAFGLGYRPTRAPADFQEEPTAERQPPSPPPELPKPAASAQPAAATSPYFWRLASVQSQPQERTKAPAWLLGQPLGDPNFYLPPPDAKAPVVPPLLARARFARFMREHLIVQRRSGEPDLRRLAQAWAARQALSRLPMLRLQRWPAQVRVVVDGAQALRPFHHDVAVLLAQMRRQLGSRLQELQVDTEPLVQDSEAKNPWPADATPTLVFSDAGAASQDAAVAHRWSVKAQKLQRAGRAPVLLTPVAPQPSLHRGVDGWQMRQFDGAGGLKHPARNPAPSPAALPPGDAKAEAPASTLPATASHLRATLWGHSYVTPAVLRALRLLLRRHGLGGGVADELTVWHDEWVASNANACALRLAYRDQVRQHFLQLPLDAQSQVVSLHLDHLAHQSPLVRAEYALHLSTVVAPGVPVTARLQSEVAAAEALAAQAAAWLRRSANTAMQQDLAAFMARLGQRSGQLLAGSERLRAAWALAQQQALRTGELDLPAGLDVEQIGWVLDDLDAAPTHRLRLFGAPDAAGQPGTRLVFEPVPQGVQPSTLGIDLQQPLPGVPYFSLAPVVAGDPMRLLVNVLGWWQTARQEGAFKDFRLNMGQAWARPLLTHLMRLEGEPERVALEWLAFCRVSKSLPVPATASTPAQHPAAELASLILAHLPEPWLHERGFRIPDEQRQRQHLRQSQAASLNSQWRWRVQAGTEEWVLEPFQRPAWADQLKHEAGTVWACTSQGRWLRWVPRKAWPVLQGEGPTQSYTPPAGFWWDADEAQEFFYSRGQQLHRPQWAVRHGVDEFGYWAEFDVGAAVSQREGASLQLHWFELRTVQRMRFIPPGRFWMGSPLAEEGRFDNEMLHPVTLSRGCWLADTDCTQGLWQAVVGSLPEGQPEAGAELPVVNISHDDLNRRFLPALADLAPQLHAHLPAEAEWEHAARAGTGTPYPWGDAADHQHMNFGGFEKQGAGQPVIVRQFNPNAWGLFQMHGNVYDWCADWFAAYAPEEALDPAGAPEAPAEQAGRVLRGGSWIGSARSCRSANRFANGPDNRGGSIGFRLARGLPEAGRPDPEAGRAAPGLPAEPAWASQPGDGAPGSPAARPAGILKRPAKADKSAATAPVASRKPGKERAKK